MDKLGLLSSGKDRAMSEDNATPNSRPSWLTVGAFTLLGSALASVATMGVKYGQQETALTSLTERNQEYRESNKDLLQNLKEWRQAYETQQAQLQSTQASLQRLKNDRCIPIQAKVDSLAITVEVASSGTPSGNLGAMQEMMKDYQASLQACYHGNI
jgi:chromosome segregation ATPase